VLYYSHGWIHLSIGRADRWLRWAIVECTLTGLLFLLALRWGSKGIAAAWTASFWILTIPAFWYAGRPIRLGITSVLDAVWKYLLASVLAGCLSLVIVRELPFLVAVSGSVGALTRVVSRLRYSGRCIWAPSSCCIAGTPPFSRSSTSSGKWSPEVAQQGLTQRMSPPVQ